MFAAHFAIRFTIHFMTINFIIITYKYMHINFVQCKTIDDFTIIIQI